MLDIRFYSALKVLLSLAVAAEEGSSVLSSAQLADDLDANPSLVRKTLVPLVREGLVESVKGRGGGTKLARPAEGITLADVYRCAVGDKPLWACRPESRHACLVTSYTSDYFTGLTEQAERAALGALDGQTLADGLRELRRLERNATQKV